MAEVSFDIRDVEVIPDHAEEYASILFLKWFTEWQQNLKFSVNSGYMPVSVEANDAGKDSRLEQNDQDERQQDVVS